MGVTFIGSYQNKINQKKITTHENNIKYNKIQQAQQTNKITAVPHCAANMTDRFVCFKTSKTGAIIVNRGNGYGTWKTSKEQAERLIFSGNE